MKLRNTPGSYGAVAITLHWLTAAAVLAMLCIGFYMTALAQSDPLVYPLFQFHKSLGLTVLALVILRLAWRLGNPPPALPAHMPAWERLAAKATHYAFYAILIGLPLSGWVMVSASPYNIPTMVFGLFQWPHLTIIAESPDKAAYEDIARTVHEIIVWTALAVIGLHAAAALRHHYMLKDSVLIRMIPWLSRKS